MKILEASSSVSLLEVITDVTGSIGTEPYQMLARSILTECAGKLTDGSGDKTYCGKILAVHRLCGICPEARDSEISGKLLDQVSDIEALKINLTLPLFKFMSAGRKVIASLIDTEGDADIREILEVIHYSYDNVFIAGDIYRANYIVEIMRPEQLTLLRSILL